MVDGDKITSTRAKFHCQSVEVFGYPHNPKQTVTAKLFPVTSDDTPENQRFNKATPGGKLEIMIDNPVTQDFFVPGKFYFGDFTEAD